DSVSALGKPWVDRAARNLRGVLEVPFQHRREDRTLVVYDSESELAVLLTEGYRGAVPEGDFLPFKGEAPEQILAAFDELEAGDLVVLVQSTSFRLDAFRIRLELFKRDLKVIEHPHLARMTGKEAEYYVDSLEYDAEYYRGVGRALQRRIDESQSCVIESGGERLVYPKGFEPAKVNIGDYAGMKNTGGQYPIGEVFTESKDLEAVYGRVQVSFFGDTSFTVNRPPSPMTLLVERGRVTEVQNSTPEFDRVLEEIRDHEGEVWLRELGFGMNRAFSAERVVTDIGTFERMCGVHLSLGAKHATYNKPQIRKRSARFHVDVFVLPDAVLLGEDCIYSAGSWCVLSEPS
ncbi:MAG: hypothetical protein AAF368_14325, partial [Planctomycetota bacterium]